MDMLWKINLWILFFGGNFVFTTDEPGLLIYNNEELPDFSLYPEEELPNFEFWNQHERFDYCISINNSDYIVIKAGERYFLKLNTNKATDFSYYRKTPIGPVASIFYYMLPAKVKLFLCVSKYGHFKPQYSGWPLPWHYYTAAGLQADNNVTEEQLKAIFIKREDRWYSSWELVDF